MCDLYTQIYGREHSTQELIEYACTLSYAVKEGELQEFCDCTEFKDRTDLSVCERYRLFMKLKWTERDTRKPTWMKRKRPYWYVPRGHTVLKLHTK